MVVSLLGCDRKATADIEKKPEPVPSQALPVLARSEAAEDAARYLAGIPGREASPFKSLEEDALWKEHAKIFDDWWGQWQKSRLPAMQEFQRTELSGKPIDGSLIFYPFGGPDVLNLLTFFPKNDTYLMVGLEPAGTLPSPEQMSGKPTAEQLPLVRDTMESMMHRSFFITRQMDHQLRGQVTDGVLPVMLVQLARNGYPILATSYVTLDAQGEVIVRDEKDKPEFNRGVALDFQVPGDAAPRRLYYLPMNLATKRLSRNKPFLSFLARQQRMITFFKSTSYMPHQDQFTLIRDQALEHSLAIVQDDSGIPYRFFDAAKWNVQLYGDYDKPYGSFRYLKQEDLFAAYKKETGVKKLNFKIGYGFSKIPSNLQIAKKRG